MGWMAEALHRSIGNWTAGAITTCIGSEKKRKVVESQNVDQIARRCKVHTWAGLQTCIGSENRLSKRERNRELDGRGDYDLHRFQNVKLTGMNVNVMSVCGSTYCLSERRSMELSIMLDLT